MDADSGKVRELLQPMLENDRGADEEFYYYCVDLYLKLLVKTGRYANAKELGEKVYACLARHPASTSIMYSLAKAEYYLGAQKKLLP